MKLHPFSEVVSDVTSEFMKIKASEYKAGGRFKIIDQGQKEVAGYTDDELLVNKTHSPIIVFGDHTRVFKYEQSPIALGADGAKALAVNPRLANPLYIYYYLRSINLKEAGYSRHFKFLKRVRIPIPEKEGRPNLDEQIRIAHVLSKVEWVIAQRKQHLQQLDDLLKSIFLEMFGDPVRNEKGWNKKPLEQLGNLDRGVSKHRPRNAPELLGGRYPLIQTGDVSNAGTYITTYTQTYSELGFTQSKLWPSGTLCITIAANIAQTSILTFDACFPDSVVGFSAFQSESNALYVHGLFWFFQRILERNAPAAAQKNINLKILRELNVPAPPPTLQNEFASIVDRVEGMKSQCQRSVADLEKLYGALGQKAFKGELDLSRVPLPAEQESSGARQQYEREDAKHVEHNVPDNINATVENLNALNASVEGLKAITDVSRLATSDLVQQDALRAIAEKMVSLRSPLQELKQIGAITAAMEQAQAALKPLNLEHIDVLTKSVELAHTLTASLPHIDMTWLEHHAEAVRGATEPFEHMRKVMERIALPTIDLSDSMRLAGEAARRLRSSIPDFNAWQQQSSDLPEAELDEEEGGVKRRFTREDINAIFAQSAGPLSFEALFNQLNELERVDLSGYETIKAILFEILAEQRLSQKFDQKTKSLLLAAHNPEAAH